MPCHGAIEVPVPSRENPSSGAGYPHPARAADVGSASSLLRPRHRPRWASARSAKSLWLTRRKRGKRRKGLCPPPFPPLLPWRVSAGGADRVGVQGPVNNGGHDLEAYCLGRHRLKVRRAEL